MSGTLYYAEKQNESQCVAFGVTFPEYYVVAATLQDGRQISIRKETEEELYDLLYRVFYAPERITEPNKHRSKKKLPRFAGKLFLCPNSMHGYFGDLCFGSAIRSIPYRCSTQICGT